MAVKIYTTTHHTKILNIETINNVMKIYSPWSKTEIKILKENFSKLSNKELSQKLKRTVGSVARKKYILRLIKSRKWDKQKIIEELKFLSNKLKHSPTSREISPTLYQACYRYFGSFNKAKQSAGLEIKKSKNVIPKSAKRLSKNLAYILGVVSGDGHVHNYKKYFYFL